MILEYGLVYREFDSDESSQKENYENFQKDINNLLVSRMCLRFNASNCSILHLVHANIRNSYKLNNVIIQRNKDVGILFPCNLKLNEHIDSIFFKAYKQFVIIASF